MRPGKLNFSFLISFFFFFFLLNKILSKHSFLNLKCEVDDEEVEYEIPCLNLVEKLSGLWEPWSSSPLSLTPHAGFRLFPVEARLYNLLPIFPHLQVSLVTFNKKYMKKESFFKHEFQFRLN